jgi:hypothetical protein
MPHPNHYLRRPARWLRRTRYILAQMCADLGLPTPPPSTVVGAGGRLPIWLRDNPFLLKTGRAETRRLGLLLRLGLTVLVLSSLLLEGLWLERTYGRFMTGALNFFFGMTFPAALFVVLTFVHVALISSARTALAVSLADEARRGTLADLLLTPLRRAEMLLAMGVAPARTAGLVALAGLPVYILLGQIGALSARDIAFLYLLFALVSYAPPLYALPALAGGAMTPDTALGKFGISRARRPARPNAYAGIGLSVLFTFFFLGQMLGILRGGWLGHLLAALHLHVSAGFSFFLFFAWPYYAMQLLSARLDFFHASLSPLWYGLPLLLGRWAASALQSASALSAGDADDMARLPIASRARTLARWTARAAGLCALGVVWRAWVESGDTATLAGGPFRLGGAPGWDAAGLLLLLGGLSLPTACSRALETPSRRPDGALRPPLRVLRRALKRSARPLIVAGGTFLLACALGGLSPFAPPVYTVAGRIALAGAASVLWAVGVRRFLPAKSLVSAGVLVYLFPVAVLSAPVPGLAWVAALSPATAWLRLFPDAAGMLGHFPLWHVAAPPSFEACLAGAASVGMLGLMSYPRRQAADPSLRGKGVPPGVAASGREPYRDRGGSQQGQENILSPPPPSEGGGGGLPTGVGTRAGVGSTARVASSAPPRHAARTAALMAWVTARTDNPLFTYEMRTRTRSGMWVTWLTAAPGALLAAAVFGLAYPDILAALAATSPLRFFAGLFGSGAPGPSNGLANIGLDLAALLLAGQCYALGFRGQVIGEGLIARDRQRGIWGFLLLTPLAAREIFWGKVWGQSIAAGVVWAGCGLVGLLLYALSVPAVGLVPALAAWLVGQVFVAALFVLGLGIGAALSTYPVFSKNLRGLSALLFVAVVGLGLWGQFQLLPMDTPAPAPAGGWSLLAGRLLLGIGYALALSAPLLAFAQWRVADVRRKDVAVGDGTE